MRLRRVEHLDLAHFDGLELAHAFVSGTEADIGHVQSLFVVVLAGLYFLLSDLPVLLNDELFFLFDAPGIQLLLFHFFQFGRVLQVRKNLLLGACDFATLLDFIEHLLLSRLSQLLFLTSLEQNFDLFLAQFKLFLFVEFLHKASALLVVLCDGADFLGLLASVLDLFKNATLLVVHLGNPVDDCL